jgi:ABC-2 type transport system permease protein
VVAQILRLKLVLMVNAFRRSPFQIVGLLFGLAYGIGSAIFLAAALFALRFFDVDVAQSAVTVFGAIVIVVFACLPLILGIEDVLDPRRFSLYGISTTLLSGSIALASLLSVSAIFIGILAVAQVSTWARGTAPVTYAIIGAVLLVTTCVLSARISTTIASFLLSSRRSRDITTIVGILLLLLSVPLLFGLSSVDWAADGLAVLNGISDVVGWTPLGAAWSAPAEAAAGASDAAIGKIVIAFAWVVILAVVWRALVAKVLITPQRQARARTYTGLGWFDRLPATPRGVIAARSLTYWTRDARYLTNLVVIPIVPLVMIAVLTVGGVPLNLLALLPIPVMCLFLSWVIHNDVAFDNTAIWLHLASSTSGSDDRVGRMAPVLGLGSGIIIVGSVISAAAYHDWSVLPSVIGVSASLLFTGLGLSSVTSAAFPYPAVRPGDNPFAQPQAGGSAAGVIQGLSFFGIVLLAVPALIAGGLGLVYGGVWPYVSLVVGLAVGAAALFGGVKLGARVYDRRGPKLLAAALKN